ncbi:MAG TPA: HEAT repeat domain-containing protein, partial [Myxococcaceae bacterium]|nr:HEAT repeat domain-containing protein [Myxococcaceae bacterium]
MSDAAEEERYRAVLAQPAADPNAVEAFARALYDESWRVRRAAVERLGEVSDRPAALSALLHALADRGQTGARNAAAEALARMGNDAAPSLVSLLGHADPDQRKFAADILALIRAPSAEPGLIAALEDPDANVRVSAAEALGRLGGPDAARALE